MVYHSVWETEVAKLTGIHVLIVEDNDHVRDFLRQVLELGGALTTATSVADALSVALAADVIVCESALVYSPEGRDLLGQLQHLHVRHGRDAPAIILFPPGTTAAAAQAAGYPYYLGRPVDGDRLRRLVTWLCHDTRREASQT